MHLSARDVVRHARDKKVNQSDGAIVQRYGATTCVQHTCNVRAQLFSTCPRRMDEQIHASTHAGMHT
jgi:hypothetical protein